MKRLLFILSYICLPLVMMAQEEVLSKINQIKTDSSYLYGEATLKTQFAASSMAKELLMNAVREWTDAQTNEPFRFTMEAISHMSDSIVMPRLQMTRFFLYVHKPSLLAQMRRVGVGLVNDTLEADTIPILPYEVVAVIDTIKTLTSFYQLKDVIKPLHEQGVIKEYGKYPTMKEPEKCYLIIYDPDGDIRAILGKGVYIRKNLTTGKADSEHSYSGCGAIWIKFED